MYRYILTFLLVFGFVFAYIDEDLDGVDDSVDKCPGTPFNVLVNADGCPLQEKGEVSAKISSSLSVDEGNTSLTSYVTLAYANQNWYFSITGSYLVDSFSNKSEVGDTYLFGSYVFPYENIYAQIGLNIKVPTSKTSKKVDFTPSLLIDIFMGTYDVFFYGNYTFTNETNLKNNFSISVGIGKQFTDKLYSSLSFDYSQTNISDQNDDYYLTGYIIYDLTQRYYVSILYSYGLNKDAIDHTFFGKIGVKF